VLSPRSPHPAAVAASAAVCDAAGLAQRAARVSDWCRAGNRAADARHSFGIFPARQPPATTYSAPSQPGQRANSRATGHDHRNEPIKNAPQRRPPAHSQPIHPNPLTIPCRVGRLVRPPDPSCLRHDFRVIGFHAKRPDCGEFLLPFLSDPACNEQVMILTSIG